MTTENGHVSNYRFPSVELLEKRNDGKEKISIAEIAENENRLKQALEQLGIKNCSDRNYNRCGHNTLRGNASSRV